MAAPVCGLPMWLLAARRLRLNGTDLRTFLVHQPTFVQGVWGRHSVPQWGVWGETPQSRVFSKNDDFLLKSVTFGLDSKLALHHSHRTYAPRPFIAFRVC